MKRIAGIVSVALVGCAANPSSDESGPAARCSVTECFNQSAIRSFEVLDDRTAVVYVGPQRCPFVVDLDGFQCSLSVTPELTFLEPLYGSTRAAEATGQICGSRGPLYVYTGIVDPAVAQGIDPVSGQPEYDTLGRRRDSFGSGLGTPRQPGPGIGNVTVDTINNSDVCRVSGIHSITDDQLLELRVKLGAPPPPPIGQGQIVVPNEPAGAEAQPPSSAPASGAGTTSGAPATGGAANSSTTTPGAGQDAGGAGE